MKTVKIVAEIPEYLRSAMAQLPERAGKSESDVIADALREYVDTHVPRLRDLKAAVAKSGPCSVTDRFETVIPAKAGIHAELE